MMIDRVLPKVRTNFTLPEILAYAKDVKKYTIGETLGFPFDLDTMYYGEAGDSVVPNNLEDNVKQLHEFLFGEDGYSPSSTVSEISDELVFVTGIGYPSESNYTNHSSGYGSQDYSTSDGAYNNSDGYGSGDGTSGGDYGYGTGDDGTGSYGDGYGTGTDGSGDWSSGDGYGNGDGTTSGDGSDYGTGSYGDGNGYGTSGGDDGTGNQWY